MARRRDSQLNAFSKIWGFCCIAILCVIFLAGFWPFCAPKNQVRWLPGADGLRFGRRGIVVSRQPFRAPPPLQAVTLEICLRPAGLSGSGTILAFNDFSNPNYVFAVRQFDQSVVVQRPAFDQQGILVRQWWRTDRIFRGSNLVVLTIVSTQQKAVLYLDGAAVSDSWDHTNMSADLTGTLVLGSSVVRDGWRGEIRGLAIYNTALTSAEIEEHARDGFRRSRQSPPASRLLQPCIDSMKERGIPCTAMPVMGRN